MWAASHRSGHLLGMPLPAWFLFSEEEHPSGVGSALIVAPRALQGNRAGKVYLLEDHHGELALSASAGLLRGGPHFRAAKVNESMPQKHFSRDSRQLPRLKEMAET